MEKVKQTYIFESGNELAAHAAKQINYHIMGYYPITPSTQVAEMLDSLKAQGKHEIDLIPAEGEHSAAGICYGASVGGGRVFNATSANGLLYALEQLPVQSGTRFPVVMNVACRTVSGPLDIKGDHSDIMYALNTGWLILFASSPQEVYDFNICALKIAEAVHLPIIIAYDGFFTSHQKRRCEVFERDEDVRNFIGEYTAPFSALEPDKPITIGSYMNEPDLMINKYQLHIAMEKSRKVAREVFEEFGELTGRHYSAAEGYMHEDAEVLLVILGSAYHTARQAVDEYRKEGKKCGAVTLHSLRPFPAKEIVELCKNAKTVVIADRQDSYGAGGGNLSLEVKAALLTAGVMLKTITRIYGLGGQDFFLEDAKTLLGCGIEDTTDHFDYYPKVAGEKNEIRPFFEPINEQEASPGVISVEEDEGKFKVKGATINQTLKIPKRLAPGHGACPGCGIPVNVNLLLRGIEGNVVLLFQTGCGMVVTTPYPQTAFKVTYVHNLFQNGAATLSGLVRMYRAKQQRGELPEGEITFIMICGDGGMDIGMGSALGTAIRGENLIIMEYDNGGYMNTGYQLSYSTPKGAKSATSHLGENQYGKSFFHKDTPQIMAAANIPYVATVAESNPQDFIRKAAKAQRYARSYGIVYLKALSACPLNWADKPQNERSVIAAAVDSCYFPLYEIERGKTVLNYNPEDNNKKIPIIDFLSLMGRTKHLKSEKYADVVREIQNETDRRFKRLKAMAENPLL